MFARFCICTCNADALPDEYQRCFYTVLNSELFARAGNRFGVQKCIETPLVFVSKGIRNLKCHVATVKSGSKASV